MTLKSSAFSATLNAADLTLVDRQIAGDRQRLLLVVEHLDLGDVDAVGLQIDLARRGAV